VPHREARDEAAPTEDHSQSIFVSVLILPRSRLTIDSTDAWGANVMDVYFIGLIAAVTLIAVAIAWWRDCNARRAFEATLEPEELEELRNFQGSGGAWHEFLDFRRERHFG
jgi:hypothetical protein